VVARSTTEEPAILKGARERDDREPLVGALPTRGAILWHAKWWIVVIAFAAGAATYAASRYIPSVYRASTTIRVVGQPMGGGLSDAAVASNDLAGQYAPLVDGSPVLARAATMLGADRHHLAGAISAGTVADQNLVNISADGSTPAVAARRANAVATAFVSYIRSANRRQAAELVASVKGQLQANEASIQAIRADITRQERVAAATPAQSSGAANAALVGSQTLLANLISQRQAAFTSLAQGVVAVQPSVTVSALAEAGTKVQPRPILYALVGLLAMALVAGQAFVLSGRAAYARGR
jgi:capsular polysaccharide biosynthesis protein